MHIHGGHNHPAYWRKHYATCPSVFLDGKQLEYVVEADDVAGYAVVYPYEDGKPKFDRDKGVFVEERFEGRVEIVGTLYDPPAAC